MAHVAAQADSRCSYCVARQVDELATVWPDVDWAYDLGAVVVVNGRTV